MAKREVKMNNSLVVVKTRKAAYKLFLPHPSKASWVGLTCPITHEAITTSEELKQRGVVPPYTALWEREPEPLEAHHLERLRRIVEYCPQCQWRRSERCRGIEGNREFLAQLLG